MLDSVIKIDVTDVSNINNYVWFTLIDVLNDVLSYFGTAVVGDYIYIVGGYNGVVNGSNTVEMLDTITDSIKNTTALPVSLILESVISVDSKLYVFGGFHSPGLDGLVDTWYFSNVMFSFVCFVCSVESE